MHSPDWPPSSGRANGAWPTTHPDVLDERQRHLAESLKALALKLRDDGQSRDTKISALTERVDEIDERVAATERTIARWAEIYALMRKGGFALATGVALAGLNFLMLRQLSRILH
ncbi:MAG: hypothetical protein NW215_10885 [Hyphomicrobiales bacterium]|nr:hypothetical protein [Hyphomicrobiales bacterium]